MPVNRRNQKYENSRKTVVFVEYKAVLRLNTEMANIDDLPDDVLEFILTHLPPYDDFENCKVVSTRWNGIVKSMFLLNSELQD